MGHIRFTRYFSSFVFTLALMFFMLSPAKGQYGSVFWDCFSYDFELGKRAEKPVILQHDLTYLHDLPYFPKASWCSIYDMMTTLKPRWVQKSGWNQADVYAYFFLKTSSFYENLGLYHLDSTFPRSIRDVYPLWIGDYSFPLWDEYPALRNKGRMVTQKDMNNIWRYNKYSSLDSIRQNASLGYHLHSGLICAHSLDILDLSQCNFLIEGKNIELSPGINISDNTLKKILHKKDKIHLINGSLFPVPRSHIDNNIRPMFRQYVLDPFIPSEILIRRFINGEYFNEIHINKVIKFSPSLKTLLVLDEAYYTGAFNPPKNYIENLLIYESNGIIRNSIFLQATMNLKKFWLCTDDLRADREIETAGLRLEELVLLQNSKFNQEKGYGTGLRFLKKWEEQATSLKRFGIIGSRGGDFTSNVFLDNSYQLACRLASSYFEQGLDPHLYLRTDSAFRWNQSRKEIPEFYRYEPKESNFDRFYPGVFNSSSLKESLLKSQSAVDSGTWQAGKGHYWPLLEILCLEGFAQAKIHLHLYNMPKLQVLSLKGLGLKELEISLGDSSKLEMLDLGYNLFPEIPYKEIAKLSNLRILDLSYIPLEKLPNDLAAFLASLPKLELLIMNGYPQPFLERLKAELPPRIKFYLRPTVF